MQHKPLKTMTSKRKSIVKDNGFRYMDETQDVVVKEKLIARADEWIKNMELGCAAEAIADGYRFEKELIKRKYDYVCKITLHYRGKQDWSKMKK